MQGDRRSELRHAPSGGASPEWPPQPERDAPNEPPAWPARAADWRTRAMSKTYCAGFANTLGSTPPFTTALFTVPVANG
jgi:hypothetical protein